MVPYAVALVLAVLAAAAVRPWLDHPSVPAEPSLPRLLANALMLQDVVGEEALSAGVWYVAIDFQLFVFSALLLAAARHGARVLPVRARGAAQPAARVAVAAATALSALGAQPPSGTRCLGGVFLRCLWPGHDGALGRGCTARQPRRCRVAGADRRVGAVALALDFRGRIAVAWCAALGLVLLLRWQEGRAALQRAGMPAAHRAQSAWSGGLARLGRISYSVFLVHFPVCLLVNAAVTKAWPESVALNALGMVAALALSIAAGWLLYERVERQVPSWTMALRWQAGLVGAGLVVALAAGHLG